LESVEGETGGIGADLVRDDGRSGALTPDLELIDSGRAECIAGGHHDRGSRALELLRELADRCRLAGAIDADDENNVRFDGCIQRQRFRDRREYALDLLGEYIANILERDALGIAALRQRRGDAARR